MSLTSWFLLNPARLMVLISILVTLFVGLGEMGGRNSGGSGWITLARLGIGACFALLTALVAGYFGGIGAAFGYFFLQLVVCLLIPVLIVEYM